MSYQFKKIYHSLQQSGREVLRIELIGIAQLKKYINYNFAKACHMIYKCKGKLVIMGIGKSGLIGKKIAATFASTGTPSFFIHPVEAIHGDIGMIDKHDIVLAISNSGESKETLSLIPILKRLNVQLICMTSCSKSSMGRLADVHLCVKVPYEACPLGLAPTTSSTATLVMGDALSIALLKLRGFTIKDFALSHPGGAIGRKLVLQVCDIMHSGNKMPYVNKKSLLRDALLEITQKTLGITIIVNDDMKIEGVFTDGDLRRAFDAGIHFQTALIADFMTIGGINISPHTLAIDALNLMQSQNITALPVVDNNSYLVGVVHIHDILRASIS